MTNFASNNTRVNWEDIEYREYLAYYNNLPFTGIAEEYLEDSGSRYLYAETEFIDGIQHGISRIYSKTNQILVEKIIYKGLAHGIQREWHITGILACEAIYDRGYCIQLIKHDQQGKEIERYELSQLHADYKMLERNRERYPNWPEVPRNFSLEKKP